MELSRRDFLRLSGTATGGFALSVALNTQTAIAGSRSITLRNRVGETTTVCPYCGVGCNAIVAVLGGNVVEVEGDPDCPINEGSLCPKGASLYQAANNPERVLTVRHRAAGATGWTDMSWDEAIVAVADRIKETSDSHFDETDSSGNMVNRTMAIASVGSVFPNSEEAYLMSKMLRALGIVYIENEARICVSAAVAADSRHLGDYARGGAGLRRVRLLDGAATVSSLGATDDRRPGG